MFKRRRSSFGSPRPLGRSRGGRPWWLRPLPLLGAVVGLIIMAELLIRIIAGLGLLGADFATYRGVAPTVAAYQLKFVDRNQRPYDGLPTTGDLQVTQHPLLGYQLVPSQANSYWQINEQGFRDSDPVPAAKPDGEIRVFVLGGSAAFGQLVAQNNPTFTAILEDKLNNRVALQTNQPDQFQPNVLPFRRDQVDQALGRQVRIPSGQYRVINAAVPGYAAGNELAQLTQTVLAYRPNLLILLDGYEDLRLASDRTAANVPELDRFLSDAGAHFKRDLNQTLQTNLDRLYLIKLGRWLKRMGQPNPNLQLISGSASDSLTSQLAADEAELTQRTARYAQHLRGIGQITASANIPTIVALQPEITSRTTPSPEEADLLAQLGDSYRDRINQGYAALATQASEVRKQFPNTMRALNLYGLFAEEPQNQAAFQSSIHLTQVGNERLADRLYRAIIDVLAIEPQPFES